MSKKARRRPKWKKPKNPVTSRAFDRLLKEAGNRLFKEMGWIK